MDRANLLLRVGLLLPGVLPRCCGGRQASSTSPYSGNRTPEERGLHQSTHIPYRCWCKVCLRANARGARRKQQYDRQPRLQADYGFLTNKDTKQVTPVPSCADVTCSSAAEPKSTTDRPGRIHHRSSLWSSDLHRAIGPASSSVIARAAGKHQALPCDTSVAGACATRGSEGQVRRL